jgi:hypothetical protein
VSLRRRFLTAGVVGLGSVLTLTATVAVAQTSTSAESLSRSLVALHAQYQAATPAGQARLASQLLTAAAALYQLLASLIENDPGEVLRVGLPAAVRAALPSAAQAYVEQEVDVEGVLEVLHEVGHAGSRYFYFLGTAAERLSLHFAADPPGLLTGARVRVRGVRVNQMLALGSGKKASVQTLSSAVPNTFGTQQTLVILVNFQDAPAEPFTPDSVRTAFFTTTSNFWLGDSCPQTSLAGDVAGWFSIAYNSTGCDSSSIANLAEAAAAAAGYNGAAYTHHVYVFPRNRNFGWGGLSTVGGNPSQAWLNGTVDLALTAHGLLGHLVDLMREEVLFLRICCSSSERAVMIQTFWRRERHHGESTGYRARCSPLSDIPEEDRRESAQRAQVDGPQDTGREADRAPQRTPPRDFRTRRGAAGRKCRGV